MKNQIEQELSQAVGKNVAVNILGRLQLSISELDESVLETDPCVL